MLVVLVLVVFVFFFIILTRLFSLYFFLLSSSFCPLGVVFIEDEGTGIGKVSTPVGLYRMMRTAPTILRLVVPQAARISVLLHDYTMVADKDESGQLSDRWKARMAEGAKSLEKRIGNERLKSLLEELYSGQYAKFATTALSYYDGLYDKHIKNWNSSGSAAGSRATNAVDVVVDPKATDVDGVVVGKQVLGVLEGLEGLRREVGGGGCKEGQGVAVGVEGGNRKE